MYKAYTKEELERLASATKGTPLYNAIVRELRAR